MENGQVDKSEWAKKIYVQWILESLEKKETVLFL